MLIDKYKPKKLDDIKGHDFTRLKYFVENYKRQKKKGLLIYGETGNGKTSSVIALANDLGLELFEMNASDFRSKSVIESVLNQTIKQQSLFGNGKLILIDDVDGISGTKDRGGIQALVKIMEKSSFPIVLTANDISDSKYSGLRKKCELLEYKEVNYLVIYNILKNICDNEGILYEDVALKNLARYCGGDVRAAINDLNVLMEVTEESLSYLSERNKEKDIKNALNLIFKSRNSEIVARVLDDINLDEALLWVEENMPLEYSKHELEMGFDALSKADVFRGRIIRWQYWRFLVYQSNLMSMGVALAKKEKKVGYVNYKRSSRILKIWIYNNKNLKKKNISEKIANKTHNSVKKTFKEIFPYYKIMFKRKINKALIEELELEKEEVMFLTK